MPKREPVFASRDDMSNAVLNWDEDGIDDMLPYAMGYRRAALTIWESLRPRAVRGLFPDFEIVPVLFLPRHAVELSLKLIALKARAVNRLYGGSQQYDNTLLSSHSLHMLWDEATLALRTAPGANLCPTLRFLPNVKPVVMDVHAVDPGSYTFRYPIRTDANLALPQHFRFSTVNAVDQLLRATEVLEDLGHEVGDWWDHEAEAYLQRYGQSNVPMLLRLRP